MVGELTAAGAGPAGPGDSVSVSIMAQGLQLPGRCGFPQSHMASLCTSVGSLLSKSCWCGSDGIFSS